MSTTSLTMAPSRLLLVLDLNGTLLDRLTSSADKRFARANPRAPSCADAVVGKGRVFLRPYLDHFLDFAFAHFHVATWTSATAANAAKMTALVCGERAAHLAFSWDRSRCQLDGVGFGSKKDLRSIWDDTTGVNRAGLWSERNTLIIDDTPGKSSLNRANHLLIPPFLLGNVEVPCDEDPSLLSVLEYLRRLLAAANLPTTEDSGRDASGSWIKSKSDFDVRLWLEQNRLYELVEQLPNGNQPRRVPTGNPGTETVRVRTPENATLVFVNHVPLKPVPEIYASRLRAKAADGNSSTLSSADQQSPTKASTNER
ncbi:hypothetical protein HK405_007594, partial [Cladochytrium tenue]